MKFISMTAIAFAVVAGAVSAQSAEGAQSGDDAPAVQSIQSLRRGSFATIQAEVVRYRDHDEILVRDASGRIEVFLGSGVFSPPVEVGETVTITGWVDDDIIDIRREIYATQIVRDDGTIIELAGRSNNQW